MRSTLCAATWAGRGRQPRRARARLYPTDEGGRIFFAFIEAMVEDLDNSTDLVLLLSSSAARSWETGQLFAARIKLGLRRRSGVQRQPVCLGAKPPSGLEQRLHLPLWKGPRFGRQEAIFRPLDKERCLFSGVIRWRECSESGALQGMEAGGR